MHIAFASLTVCIPPRAWAHPFLLPSSLSKRNSQALHPAKAMDTHTFLSAIQQYYPCPQVRCQKIARANPLWLLISYKSWIP